MKTIKILFFLIMVLLVSVIACKKGETPTPTPTINPIDQFFSDNIAEAVQLTTVDVSSSPIIIGEKGTQITITPSSFVDASGNPVTGEIDFELIEAQDNADMLMLNRQTITDNGQILNSGGIVYVNATQDGEALTIVNGLETRVPVDSDNQVDGMTLFSGDTTANGDFVWTEIDSSWVGTESDSTITDSTITGVTGDYFYFTLDNVGWTNIDMIDGTSPYTGGIDVVLPSGHDGSNSVVYMYFTSINSVIDLYEGNILGTFSMGSQQISTGYTVQFVAVSEINSQWFYHVTAPIQLADPHTEIIPTLTSVADAAAANTAILPLLQ